MANGLTRERERSIFGFLSLRKARLCSTTRAIQFSDILGIKNNLSAANVDAVVGSIVVADVRVKNAGSISNTALSVGIVLARTPLPDLSVINVSFAGRMVEAQESARKNRDGILVVSDAREPATELAVDVVGEILVSDLCREER